MKNRMCPQRSHCWDYRNDSCDGCAIGDKLDKLHRKIERLEKKNARLEQELAAAAPVRCRECIHRHPNGPKCTIHQIVFKDDHFCSDGKKKEDTTPCQE